MSIKQLSLVWEYSKAKGSDLLVLLSLGDLAKPSGYCWPGYSYIAKMSRLSRRQVIRIVDNLVISGELVKLQSDRKKSNEYILWVWPGAPDLRQCVDCLMFEIVELEGFDIHHVIPITKGGTDDPSNKVILCKQCHNERHNVASDIITLGVKGDTRVVTPLSPEPSLEPSLIVNSNKPPQNLTDTELQKVFIKVTGSLTFPSKSMEQDITRLRVIAETHGQETIEYLSPFFQEWRRRGYSKANTSWLDWATAGETPKQRSKTSHKNNGRSMKHGFIEPTREITEADEIAAAAVLKFRRESSAAR